MALTSADRSLTTSFLITFSRETQLGSSCSRIRKYRLRSLSGSDCQYIVTVSSKRPAEKMFRVIFQDKGAIQCPKITGCMGNSPVFCGRAPLAVLAQVGGGFGLLWFNGIRLPQVPTLSMSSPLFPPLLYAPSPLSPTK